MLSRLLVGVFFLGYLLAQAPHLVHHFFEPDEVQADCVFLAAAERQQAASPEDPTPLSAETDVSVLLPALDPPAIAHDPGPSGARAPPFVV